METVFHYPPEVLALLVDTIPLLCRTKKSVLLFFQGAGVESAILDDLWWKINTDSKSVSKYEMVSTILKRVNELGDEALRERREIIKRVVEFENFSTCWPDDQLKARGLVSEIRSVVNVKDSFTKMKDEYEAERTKNQAEHKKQIEEVIEKNKKIEKIRKDLFSLFSIPEIQSQKRGKLLEGILNRLFEVYGILVKEAFVIVENPGEGITEQIDGLVVIDGKMYLVEMKWWNKPLGKSDISPHLVNILNRSDVGGILISTSGYTLPAINTCKDALSKKTIVLCDLEEIVRLLESSGDLMDLLREKIMKASIEKQPFYKLEDS